MHKVLLKLLTLILLISSLYGQTYVAHAESNNGYVHDYINKQNKKSPEEAPKNVNNTDNEEKTNGSITTIWDGAKMVFALLFVIGLLYVLLKYINKKSRSYQQNRLIQNFGGTPLGGNRSLQIVKAGNRILILGVGEDINLLKEIEDEQEVEEFIKYYKDQLEQSLEPRDIITKLTKKLKNKQVDSQTKSAPFQAILKKQLESLNTDRKKAMKKLEQKEQKTDE